MMPEHDVARRYVVQKTTAATLDFAAVMAVASRIHAGYEKQFPGTAPACARRQRKPGSGRWQIQPWPTGNRLMS